MRKKINYNQLGFVSIIVTALIMIILSLITLGFARLMQREQRQSLDQQLSRQALYAAESGINDTLAFLSSGGIVPDFIDNCEQGVEAASATDDGVIDPNNPDIEYTCVLYDTTPTSLLSQVNPTNSELSLIEATEAISTLTYSWGLPGPDQNLSSLPSCSSAGNFLPDRPGVIPILKIDLSSLGTISRDFLFNNTAYLYAAPCSPGGSNAVYDFSNSSNRRGVVVPVSCNDPGERPCSLQITGLSSAASTRYFSRMKPIYESAVVETTGTLASGGPVEFTGSQATIDVTARAGDVVRRLRVTADPTTVNSNPVTLPEAAFQANDGFCKLSQYYPWPTPPYDVTFNDACQPGIRSGP